MQELLDDAAKRSIRYLEGLTDRGVAPDPAALAQIGRAHV